MISAGVIRNGSTYLGQHLRKNDYWAEGERAREGEWIGLGAERLGLQGEVSERDFEALRTNKHPQTKKQLTARRVKERVAFFDVQISAPKDYSVLAMLGDERLGKAFRDSVRVAVREMEHYAAVRERRGKSVQTEAYRLTGNIVAALFFHDTSRELDPQLHAHVVTANATWDESRQGWYALQAAPMLRASKYVRQVFYRELFGQLLRLGYEPYALGPDGFSITGVEHLRERFSKRSQQVKEKVAEFVVRHGREPSKKEIAILVRESRGRKLREVSTEEVRRRQKAELNPAEAQSLRDLVTRAHAAKERRKQTVAQVQEVLESALRHAYERSSVVRDDEVLAAALTLYPDFMQWQELREALGRHPQVVRSEGEMTLREIIVDERQAVQHVKTLRGGFFPLGRKEDLTDELTLGQTEAAGALLGNRDGVAVLVGDAGTGKTRLLAAIEDAHRICGGKPFLALAPTTKARDALRESGFAEAETVQRFLAQVPTGMASRVVLVDEAGLVSMRQLTELLEQAVKQRFRLILVGDPKQHYSVQRGDALRHLIKHSDLQVTRLAEVLRQRETAHRELSRLLGQGRPIAAFAQAQKLGMVSEETDENRLFDLAAAHYARNRAAGIDTLVVIPLWEEIDRFSLKAREALRQQGVLGHASVERATVQSLAWTEEQKQHWSLYRTGDYVTFVRETRHAHRGQTAEVVKIEKDGVRVKKENGRELKITRRHKGTFEVARPVARAVAVGDRLLMRARGAGFKNGEIAEVTQVDPVGNEIHLADGRRLPPDFKTWTYAHALTSYRAQGTTVEESLLVLGHQATAALRRRQFYVGATRYRAHHHFYVSSRDAVIKRLAQSDEGRELALDFLRRRGVGEVETLKQNVWAHVYERVKESVSHVARRSITKQQGIREEV